MTDLEIAFENFKFNFPNLTEEQHNEVLRIISSSLVEFQKEGGMSPTDGSIYRTMLLCGMMKGYIPITDDAMENFRRSRVANAEE